MAKVGVKPPPRLVLDTNTVVSALLFANGRLSWLRLAWQAQRLMPLVSRDTAAELVRVLAYPKFKLSSADREELLADYLPYCEVVSVPENQTNLPSCRDAADLPFLQLALAAKADALVSGDADLLELKMTFSVPILSPSEIQESVHLA